MGWDAFGLPAEVAAQHHSSTPSDWTTTNIHHMATQLQSLDLSFNWENVTSSSSSFFFKKKRNMTNLCLSKKNPHP
jgi:leucyl-tRNA synthetase